MDDVSPKRAARARIVSRLPVSPDARDLFVGREAELGRLVRALDRAIAHEGQLVLLVGDPGIGKTRIARELAFRAAALGVAVRWGRCQETEGAPPYWPWVQVLRARERIEPQTDAHDPAAAALAALLADHAPRPGDTSGAESTHARFQLFETIAGALRTALCRSAAARCARRPALGRRRVVAPAALHCDGARRRTPARPRHVPRRRDAARSGRRDARRTSRAESASSSVDSLKPTSRGSSLRGRAAPSRTTWCRPSTRSRTAIHSSSRSWRARWRQRLRLRRARSASPTRRATSSATVYGLSPSAGNSSSASARCWDRSSR